MNDTAAFVAAALTIQMARYIKVIDTGNIIVALVAGRVLDSQSAGRKKVEMSRYATTKELMEHLSVGRNTALKLGEMFGAKISITPKLVRYDLEIVDREMAKIKVAGNEVQDG